MFSQQSCLIYFTRLICCLSVVFVFPQVPCTSGDLFAAVSDLKSLVGVEQQLADYLQYFVNQEQKKLDAIKLYYEKSKHLLQMNTSNEINVSMYVGNPINSYLIVKRLLRFGTEIEKLIDKDFTRELVMKLQTYRLVFPSDDDVKGAQNALLRLQTTYNLPPATFSDGIAPNASAVTQMNAEDALAIGKEAYGNEDYVEVEMWMREALRLINIGRGQGTGDDNVFEVLDHLAWAEYLNGHLNDAINHTVELLQIDPSNQRLRNNHALYQRLLNEKRAKMMMNRKFAVKRKKKPNVKKSEKYQKFYYTKDEDHYQRYLLEKVTAKSLCRGETRPGPRRHRHKLICWLKKSDPRLILKPAKVERIYVRPEVLMFRKVFEDKKMQKIKDVAVPLLSRATVHNPQTGKIEQAKYRISKSAWLDKRHDPVIGNIDNRIEAITGLSLTSAESLQVANYGIGGHYDTHFDFSRSVPIRPPPSRRDTSELTHRSKNEAKSEVVKQFGERIATFLLYMSDVEMGGGTVFTNIRQQIRPSKGDAVFWYNLNDDGTGDYNTRHAACPVLLGEKWVANKWFHESGQEFRRRCPLNRYPPDED